MDGVIYLSLADILALHEAIMERTGFRAAPLRDEGALESAIMRPRMAAHYELADLIRQAALLAVGISQAHAFVDGNKRTAFAATDVFLGLNGKLFKGQALDYAKQIEAVAGRSVSLAEATEVLEKWLREHVQDKGLSPEARSNPP
jgi:death-on-curing protein